MCDLALQGLKNIENDINLLFLNCQCDLSSLHSPHALSQLMIVLGA
jgi:hypothetical protein